MILSYSKLNDEFKVIIPKEIRETFDIDNETIVEWGIDENGKPEINFRKKICVNDIVGL